MMRPGRLRAVLVLLLLLLPAPLCAVQANIFVYHRFGDGRYPSTNIPSAVFAAQLDYLRQQQIPVVSLATVVAALQGKHPLPEHAVVLTVDDAYASFLEQAMPLLRKYGYPVTLFVNSDNVGQSDYLSWEQLRRLVKEGVEIGNHSASHAYLLERHRGETTAEWERSVREDISKAQTVLREKIGVTPRLFAYPYGEFSPALEALVRKIGFIAAVGQQSGVVGPSAGLFALPRFPMGGGYATLQGFRAKVAMHPLQIELLEPVNPVLTGTSPPQLRVRLAPERYELNRLQGFVQGDNRLRIKPLAGVPGGYVVQAERPLAGRRNKYTLTVPLRGGGWAWFSQPWFRPQSAIP